MLAELERCQRCGVRYEDHDVQNKCIGFLSLTEKKKLPQRASLNGDTITMTFYTNEAAEKFFRELNV